MKNPAHTIAYGALSISFSAAGDAEVRCRDRVLITGRWNVIATGHLHTNPTHRAATPFEFGPIRKTSLTYKAARSVRVTSMYDSAEVVYTLKLLSGEKLSIELSIEHTGKSDLPIRMPTFYGWAHHFNRRPTSNLYPHHPTYFAGHDMMHPSPFTPIGAGYLHDDMHGIGLHTVRHLAERKWITAAWQGDGFVPAESEFNFCVDDVIHPGDLHHYDLQLCIAAKPDWRHLLAPYRAAYNAVMPPQAYEPDFRPVAFHGSADGSWVRPDNPYGFNDGNGWRRRDKPEGVALWKQQVLKPFAAAGGGAFLYWSYMGHNERGAKYRPDFDVFPPEIDALAPSMAANHEELGLTAGLAARPGEIVTPGGWAHDMTLRPGYSEEFARDVVRRFENTLAQGFRSYYLDVFGSYEGDQQILHRVRQEIPGILKRRELPFAAESVQFWMEYSTDMSLPYAGRYTESPIVPTHFLEICQFLRPQNAVICKPVFSSEATYTPALYASAMDGFVEQMGQQHITPMIEDWLIGANVDRCRAWVDRFLDSQSNWK